ncbi:albusnodin/ikarugamycin family macrolactam cyclase [Nocardiopsis sp. NPDC007018]|uniref:albusnodin/ikarugamycin family macrolactam cyclase n=1 Tax=Nocardiopsis sp. NPDC007018 TaxID=3155721 RepID=UPI0033C6806D
MEWFGGSVATTGAPAPRPLETTWSLVLAKVELWTAGTCSGRAVATAVAGPEWVAVFGTHGTDSESLETWLSVRGESDPPPWPGTYTVVVGNTRGISVFTDPAHALPIYYTEVDGALVWASSSRALSGLTGLGPNLTWVSRLLANPPESPAVHDSGFQRVCTVPPGHCLEVTGDRPPRVRRWWSPPAGMPRMEASRQFRQALDTAVALRLGREHHVSCDLSGGLDSTTLCLLAARQREAFQILTACTVHPESRNRGGDLDYARAAAKGREGVNHMLLPLSEQELPYSSLGCVPPTDEPAPTTITAARHRFAYERISAAGSTVHMTGDGGDALLMQSPDLAIRLALHGHPLRALRDVHGWAKLDRTSPARLLSRVLRVRVDTPPHWLTPKALGLASPRPGPRALRYVGRDAEMVAIREIGRTAYADVQFASRFGVRLEAPFLDRAVVEAGLAFRLRDRGSPWSYKPQLTRTMTDVLPHTVLERRTKGGTDADHHLGLRIRLHEVSALLDGWLAGHGLIDPQAVRAELRAAESGKEYAWGALEPVIAAEVWSRTVTAYSPPQWLRPLQPGMEAEEPA